METRENILSTAVPITLDGRELLLRYRAYAFIRYAEECKGDLLVDLRQLGGMLQDLGAQFRSPDAAAGPPPALWGKLRDIVWAGLADAQPEITRDQVARMFGLADWTALMPAVMAAFQRTLPEAAPVRPIEAAADLTPAPLNGSPLPGGSSSGPDSATPAASPLPNLAD